jgi:sec-independent protein translocase protein TatB
MFDVGFWEVALIGVIALLVVGPERLPALARNVGRWVGTLRRYVAHVKQDIEREIHADEVRELINQPDALRKSIGSSLDDLKDVARETGDAVSELKRGLDDAAHEGIGEAAPARADATTQDEGVTRTIPEDGSGASVPRVAHHAVDEDPFAPASPAGEAAQEHAAAPDASETASSQQHEQTVEQQRRD